MRFSIAPGVFDILPYDEKDLWKSSFLWNYVESIIRKTAAEYHFQEIRTPVFEYTDLFKRSVGEGTDIASKEMYTFEDRGGRSMSLRPEGTASVIRSLVENQVCQKSTIQKVFYIAPMFRYERAQAGRYRQHHQFGVEVIGNNSAEQDAELIDFLFTIYQRLGLKKLKLMINSIGVLEERVKFKESLKNYLHQYFDQLSKESQTRFHQNPLRILDSKDEQDQKIISNAPNILEYLGEESKAHFEKLQYYLAILKIPFEINPKLVRGLDYYNNTVFEIVAGELGAQNSIAGGGRYDGLMKQLGGPDLPSIGFGTGLERIIQTMIKQEVALPKPPAPELFFIPLGEKASKTCFEIIQTLRHRGISCEMDFSGRKLSKVMQYANQLNAKSVAVVGDQELETGIIELKNMVTGEKAKAPLHHLERIIEIENKTSQLLSLWQELNKPFENEQEASFFMDKIQKNLELTKKVTGDLQLALEGFKTMIKE